MQPFRKNLAIAIDGGGIKGVMVTKALSMVEKQLGYPLHERTDSLPAHPQARSSRPVWGWDWMRRRSISFILRLAMKSSKRASAHYYGRCSTTAIQMFH